MPDPNSTPEVRPCPKCGASDWQPTGGCRPCAAKKYAENKALVREKQAAYRKTNADKIRASRLANAHKHIDSKKAWSDANQERIKAHRVAYWKANKERLSAESAIYREKNREELRRKEREKYKETYDPEKTWAKLNPERNRENSAAYRAANPELRIIWENKRRARKRNSGGTLSKGITEKLFKLQKGKCACCSLPLEDGYHLDHIMPLALGGSNTDDNMQLLTATCNMQKKAKHPIDFMQSRGFLL